MTILLIFRNQVVKFERDVRFDRIQTSKMIDITNVEFAERKPLIGFVVNITKMNTDCFIECHLAKPPLLLLFECDIIVASVFKRFIRCQRNDFFHVIFEQILPIFQPLIDNLRRLNNDRIRRDALTVAFQSQDQVIKCDRIKNRIAGNHILTEFPVRHLAGLLSAPTALIPVAYYHS
nr:MAG TPA: hypothetical protein [Caudoviricetes sp.]